MTKGGSREAVLRIHTFDTARLHDYGPRGWGEGLKAKNNRAPFWLVISLRLQSPSATAVPTAMYQGRAICVDGGFPLSSVECRMCPLGSSFNRGLSE